jgi:hypothetical protein
VIGDIVAPVFLLEFYVDVVLFFPSFICMIISAKFVEKKSLYTHLD